MLSNRDLTQLTKRIRYNIITSTTAAGSGHPSTALSAVELTTVLFFGGFFKQDISDFKNPNNDKFILSKGHAAPLLYALYEAAGTLSHDEMLSLRKFSSHLQGHPTPELPFVDVTTGSLGQGLSVGVGMALGLKRKSQIAQRETLHDTRYTPSVYVLLGDSEFAEGQNYEALQMASYYKLGNLIGILDINRLGQRGETMVGWDLETYQKRIETFGWNTIIIQNGHDIEEIQKAFSFKQNDKPTMIIAKTFKGKGVSLLENKDNWHGKAIPKDKLEEAVKEIGEIDFSVNGTIAKPGGTDLGEFSAPAFRAEKGKNLVSPIATREAYGFALADLTRNNKQIVALDAETSNSTYSEFVKKETPEQFIECYIAEQNMVSMALGLSKVGYIPFLSSFAAFLTRALDQIRMSQYSNPTLNIVGSHAGCSIGVDGASQMALEDIAMMRSIRESTVLYPSDGVSAYKLTQAMANHPGITYLRTTREKLPILYDVKEEFPIGGCKIHGTLHDSRYTSHVLIIAAGITVHEALKAQKQLEAKQIHTVVVDLYSVKPLDSKTLIDLAQKAKHIIVVEDHYEAGGIGEAVLSVLSQNEALHASRFAFMHLCVRKEPRSGSTEELLRFEEIDAEAIEKCGL